MKKKALALIFSAAVLSTVLMGCSGVAEAKRVYDVEAKDLESMFIIVENGTLWDIVYDKETKVMYAIANYGSGSGQFTLLVDENGNPKLWDGE